MKKYEKPLMEIIEIGREDVITGSGYDEVKVPGNDGWTDED